MLTANMIKKYKISAGDLETFINGILKDKLSKQKINCIVKALDRDEDNLVSYYEFQDSIYGAE